MNVLVFLLGVLLLLAAIVDALWTTLWVDGGAGPISSRVTTWAWRAAVGVVGRQRHRLLSLFGPLILLSTVLLWVLLMWGGWVLVFGSDVDALKNSRTNELPGWPGRIAFVAQSMFTMGNGDYYARGEGWQLAGAFTTASGMLLVTLAITYLLSVVSAVVSKRSFASQVTGVGESAEEFVRLGWNGQNLSTLDRTLSSLSTQLSTLSEQYLAYPILQYYHAAKPTKAPPISIAILDDALTLLRFGVAEQARPNPLILNSARESVRSYLDTLPTAFINPASDSPPAPSLASLREAGIPTVSDAEFARALEDLEQRRRKLLGLVRNDGLNWSDR